MRVPLKQKIATYRSLASLLEAGVTFPAALEKNAHSPWLRSSLHSLQSSLRAGRTLEETAAEHPSVFSPLETGLLAAGERCGRLETACKQLASHFELLNRLSLQTRLQLGYPLFLLCFALLCSGVPALVEKGWIAFCGVVLPRITLALAGLLFLALLLRLAFRVARNVSLLERGLLLVPVLGPLYRDWIAFRFASIHGLCIQTGLPILQTLRLSGPASQSALLNQACESASRSVLQGKTVGEVLADARILPDSLLPLWLSGEESGSLDRNLAHWCQNSVDELRLRTEAAVAFGTRGFGLLVMLGIGWRILAFSRGYFAFIEQF